jgi:acetoin utilization deacetylase AcuC-like enzyme
MLSHRAIIAVRGRRTLACVAILLGTHPAFAEHLATVRHPERPARLDAVLTGIRESPAADAVQPFAPAPATRQDLERVHPAGYLDELERFCAAGGGRIDADTAATEESWDAALLAAGAGIDAVGRLDRGDGDAAFLAVRPPGHHALPGRPMGFCLLNNVAVTAAFLADRGERVLIVDWDAHHGNGTQDVFYEDGRVVYVSLHQWPLYPGTGSLDERGSGDGAGTTLNLPMPPGADGDAYRAALDEVVASVAEAFTPTWVLVSAGFDAHRADPLTDLNLTAGDYVDLTDRVVSLVPPGRRIAFLEGGYDLDALRLSAGATVAALAGETWRPEAPSTGGVGSTVVEAAKQALSL